MTDKSISVKVFRFDPLIDKEPQFKEYRVPFEPGMSAMNALDYVYQNLDSSVAYYDHAGCCLGICGRCTGKINGKSGLLCQTLVEGDMVLEPVNAARVIKDLVVSRSDTK